MKLTPRDIALLARRESITAVQYLKKIERLKREDQEGASTLKQQTISDLMSERDELLTVAGLAAGLREGWEEGDDITLHEKIDYLVAKALHVMPNPTIPDDTAIGLLEEAAGTFGEIGTDEPVNGGDTVDWLNDWIPRVRKLLSSL